jgi:putative DNA primase/helicase
MSENDENYPEGFEAPDTTAARPNTDISDVDRAERFIEFLNGYMRYVPQNKKWMYWDDAKWTQDENGAEIMQVAIEFSKERVLEANEIQEPKERQKAWVAAKQAQSRAALDAMIDVASSYPGVCTHLTEFDSNPWLFGLANGVYDLKKHEFRPATKEDLVWKRSPVSFDPEAKCPMFDDFLATIQPDANIREFLQRAQGYSMTASTVEQVLFFLYGSGQNGKSTYISLMEKIMGDYSWRTNAKLFLDDRFGGDPANLMASLPEMRIVIGAEVGDSPMAEGRVKDLTGGDTLNACRKYCEAFTFRPTHKLWFYGNDRPTINNSDDGIWRRMCLVPFEVKIPDHKRDYQIDDKLWSEASGILNWMIAGCKDWQQKGLRKPEAVVKATDEYRESEDTIGEFFEEQTAFEPEGFVCSGPLYSAYALWCESRGIPKNRIKGEKKVAAWLRHKGCMPGKRKIGGSQFRVWNGIKLVDPKSFIR